MKITIYGTGYVGLVTGACLAECGHEVLCIDINAEKIRQLNAGNISIFEPGLSELVKKNLAAQRLKFNTDAILGISFSTVQIITVNTPTIENGGSDISNILKVANTIANSMTEYKLIINKSTAPPGTVNKIKQLITTVTDISFDVASNPEFLKEGAAITDFMHPERIVIGLENEAVKTIFSEIYHNFSNKLIYMNIASAELSKYAANAMLATRISFINEIANIAEKAGANIEAVKQALSLDPRIGPHFINPGCGYGGSCFPKDVTALAYYARNYNIEPLLLNAVAAVNQFQKTVLGSKILTYFNHNIKGKTIALWGLAFKPNTNDMREASSITLMKMLWDHGAIIQAYDPVANHEAAKLFDAEIKQGQLILCENAYNALNQVDALAIVTEWQEFKEVSLSKLKKLLQQCPIFDGRNIFEPLEMQKAHITYFSIGRNDFLALN